jgi:ribosomal protein L11 methylase PrmA
VISNSKDLKDCSVLCANILFEPLITLRDDFIKYIRPHGYGIFSGILQTQADDFKKHYQDYFYILQEITDDGWTSFLLQKRN